MLKAVQRTSKIFFHIINLKTKTTKSILLLLAAMKIRSVYAQITCDAIITDSETQQPLIGATAVLKGTTKGSTANLEGLLSIENIPDGKQIIVFSYIGYETKSDTFSFPLTHTEPFQIELNPKAGELEEVVISS